MIIILPKNQRARNRVAEHGKEFELLEIGNPQCTNGLTAMFVESKKTGWKGWFSSADVFNAFFEMNNE